ncbi:MscL family protein [Branchiibius sp. NY16-3462-2]|uniref:MscL family protein n=1 Tax=Branchiibius sp. NY16-3462-2 TaxID=1807500 RepID=UPI0007956DCD|nr:MscL family protein [Branchiibius sp. NY16-3462-2]KYH45631.1 mechanosensitive ion channel protein MscL [Branchiibius sp. NY16-3462-2]
MLKGFKDFLFQGNLIELATAFVIGAAFTTLVNTFTSAIIEPVLNAFGGKNASQGLGFRLVSDNPSTFISISAIINALIVFVLTAAVLYFLFIVPYERSKKFIGIEDAENEETDKDILSDIRGLLREQRGGRADGSTVADPADG